MEVTYSDKIKIKLKDNLDRGVSYNLMLYDDMWINDNYLKP